VGQLSAFNISRNFACSSLTHPLPRGGTDPIQVRPLTFEAKPLPSKIGAIPYRIKLTIVRIMVVVMLDVEVDVSLGGGGGGT